MNYFPFIKDKPWCYYLLFTDEGIKALVALSKLIDQFAHSFSYY